MKRPFIPLSKPSIEAEEIDSVIEVVKSGWWTTGPKVFEFEKKLSAYLEEKHQLYTAAVNSCTSAMFLTLKALGIKKGDQVILPTWTFASTALIVEWLGATPVLCDIEAASLNIDVHKAETLITEKTKALIPVHVAGFPCEMDHINELSKKYHLKVVDDAAHAIGTRYNNIKIGNFSDASCFSFYATKNLAMGEGGAVVSKNKTLIDKITKLSYFGINKEAHKRYSQKGSWFYDIEEMGYKCNLDSMHAALGLIQLEKIDTRNKRRREIAHKYRNNLDTSIEFTKNSDTHYHVYHLFPILLPHDIQRDDFIESLKEKNIGSSVHFIPLHKHSYFRSRYPEDHFPVANSIYERIVSIPMYPSMTNQDVDYVIHTINSILRR